MALKNSTQSATKINVAARGEDVLYFQKKLYIVPDFLYYGFILNNRNKQIITNYLHTNNL